MLFKFIHRSMNIFLVSVG